MRNGSAFVHCDGDLDLISSDAVCEDMIAVVMKEVVLEIVMMIAAADVLVEHAVSAGDGVAGNTVVASEDRGADTKSVYLKYSKYSNGDLNPRCNGCGLFCGEERSAIIQLCHTNDASASS